MHAIDQASTSEANFTAVVMLCLHLYCNALGRANIKRIILQGPAVHALRAQTDKVEYAQEMRRILEETPNLFLREGMAVGLDLGPNDEVQGVQTFFGLSFRCRAAVVTTGTFMNGRIWVGRQSMPAGRYTPTMLPCASPCRQLAAVTCWYSTIIGLPCGLSGYCVATQKHLSGVLSVSWHCDYSCKRSCVA